MDVRCAVCRAEYPSAKGFHRRPVGKGRFELLCPGCSDRQNEAAYRFVMAISAGMTVAGLLLFHRFAWATAILFWGVLFMTPTIFLIPHELGHAMVAIAVRLRLFTVTIGALGRVWFVWRVFGYDIVVHRVLWGGSAFYTFQQLRWVRLRHFAAVLGGPLADVLLLALTMAALVRLSDREPWYWICAALLFGNILQLAISLLPRRVWVERERLPNDGMHLLLSPFMPYASLVAWHSMTFYYEALEALERGRLDDAEHWVARGKEVYPENAWGPSIQADILASRQRHAEARALWLKLLDASLPPENAAYLWNNIARTDLLIADPALLEEADLFSRQALEAVPWVPEMKGTRGSVLVERGRIDDGVALLEQAFYENSAPSSRALNACYLALAMFRQGDLSQARHYLAESRRLDPNCLLLRRVTEEESRLASGRANV